MWGDEGVLEGNLVYTFSLLVLSLRWHKKEWGPIRARGVLPHNLPKYLKVGK